MYRFNPDLRREGKSPFSWDNPAVDADFGHYVQEEIRYRSLMRANPEEAERLLALAKEDNERRFNELKHLQSDTETTNETPSAPAEEAVVEAKEEVHD